MSTGTSSKPSRVFIDCSFINFSRQPTGIPRVVLKYIEVGYAWGKRNNIEVIPIIPSADTFTLCRPLPGLGAPQTLIDRAIESEAPTTRSRFDGVTKAVLEYLKNVVRNLLALAAALLPIPPVKATSTWIDDAVQRGYAAFNRRYETRKLSLIRYSPSARDVLFAPAYWHDVDPMVYSALRAKGVVVVILVHDLLPIIFENFYPSPWRYLFKDNVRKAFGYSSAFFCVSNYTKNSLAEFGEREKLKPVPIMTSYNGFEPLVNDETAEEIRQGKATPVMGNHRFYAVAKLAPILMVGSVEPKKGHIPVIKCLEAMWRAGYARPMAIIGRTGWMERDVVAAIEGSEFYQKKLFWFTDIDDYDLALGYMFCHALVFSSLAEGFGIPMIEASYYGKPTIAYETAIVREVLGDKGLLFNSAYGLVGHLASLENPQAYARACATAKRLEWPLWDEYTPHVFDTLAGFDAQGTNEAIPPEVAWRKTPLPAAAIEAAPELAAS